MRELALIVSGAAIASAAITGWHDRPAIMVAACVAVLAALLFRYHQVRDLTGLAIGATVGNAIELACDAAGLWQHANRSVLGLAPAYILLCYPILGLVTPRLVESISGGKPLRDRGDAIASTTLLAALVALSMRFGTLLVPQSIACIAVLAVTLWRFHSRHDLVAAVAGAAIAMVWEVPATLAGAWRFPEPNLLGIIPAWLPVAYAVFFITMHRLINAAAGRAEAAMHAWQQLPWTAARRHDLVLVSALIALAVVNVCLFFRMPVVCAIGSAIVLGAALRRWHTTADVCIAITGAIFGPVLEYFATTSSLWIYPYTTVGSMPAWVFTLWPAFPLCLVRLTHTLWPPERAPRHHPADVAAIGLAILLIEIPLLAMFGNARPGATALATAVMLVAAATTLRSPQATLMLTLSGVFGMLCELLPIALGAWRYPLDGPLPFPLWLPTGYALFGFGIVQLAQGLDGVRAGWIGAARRQLPAQRQPHVDQRRPEHAIAGR